MDMYRLSLTFTIGIFALAGCGPREPSRALGPVELKPVAASELDGIIEHEKGKVVFAEVWFYGCAPCRKKFPHLVKLHEAHAKDGLVVLSIDVEPNDMEHSSSIEKFLRENEADFSHYIIMKNDQARSDWLKKYSIRSTPTFLAFDRSGKQVNVPEPASADDVDAFLSKLLEEK